MKNETKALTVSLNQMQRHAVACYGDILSFVEEYDEVETHLNELQDNLHAIMTCNRSKIADALRQGLTCLLLPGFDEQEEVRITNSAGKVVMVFVGDEINY